VLGKGKSKFKSIQTKEGYKDFAKLLIQVKVLKNDNIYLIVR
jgi:hypothetical protein